MTRRFLLDTNHLGLSVAAGTPVAVKLHTLRLAGIVVGTCVPVLCELEAGVQYVRDVDTYRANLHKIMKHIRIWPLDIGIAREFGRLDADLRKRGRVLSQVDMMLAAMARCMHLVIATTDRDFEALPDIPTENWMNAR